MLLYDNPASSNALKVRFLLAELGLAYDRHEVPMLRPRPDDYVALNPFTGIPTLDDDGFVLTESNAILRYLALREKPRGPLSDRAPRARAGERAARPVRADGAPGVLQARGGGARLQVRHRLRRGAERPGAGGGDRRADRAADRAAGARCCRTASTRSATSRSPTARSRRCCSGRRSRGWTCRAYPKLSRLRDALLARPAFVAAGPVT